MEENIVEAVVKDHSAVLSEEFVRSTAERALALLKDFKGTGSVARDAKEIVEMMLKGKNRLVEAINWVKMDDRHILYLNNGAGRSHVLDYCYTDALASVVGDILARLYSRS